jgi:anti-anti-sigma factor
MLRSTTHPDSSDTCVLVVDGDFDGQLVPSAREALSAALLDGSHNVLLDLSGVDYMDSSALGFIVWADARLRPLGGRLALAGAGRDVARILELSGLIGLAPTVVVNPSVVDALRSVHVEASVGTPLWTESFEIPADPGRLADARTRVGRIIEPLHLPESIVFDIKVALGEALTNAVRHGSPQGLKDIVTVEIRVFPDRVVVVVSDRGAGFDGAATRNDDEYAVGGRGVLFMRALMDAVRFVPGPGNGTDVVLVKLRGHEVAAADPAAPSGC